MTLTAYRLCVRRYAARAFAGEGARQAGGRWNPRGMAVVYASASLSLAALEFLVHLSAPPDAPELAYFSVKFDSRLVSEPLLPKNWTRLKLSQTRRLGRAWIEGARSPVLRVPSFVVPSEVNYVLNPAHPHFNQIKIGPARLFGLDPRLY